MFRVAIVEDQKQYRDLILSYLKRFEAEEGVQIECGIFQDGLNFISDYKGDCDLILMDIEMPLMDGMTAAKRIREMDENVCLIFITGLAKYAIEGYEVRALDFLLKPVEYKNFSIKVRKAFELRRRFRKKEFVLTTSRGIQRISVDDLYYLEVMDHTLIYHTSFGDFSERGSISQMEEMLEPYDFCRCNNSFLVNLRYVSAMNKDTITVHHTEIPVGRTKKKIFLQKLTEFMGVYMQ